MKEDTNNTTISEKNPWESEKANSIVERGFGGIYDQIKLDAYYTWDHKFRASIDPIENKVTPESEPVPQVETTINEALNVETTPSNPVEESLPTGAFISTGNLTDSQKAAMKHTQKIYDQAVEKMQNNFEKLILKPRRSGSVESRRDEIQSRELEILNKYGVDPSIKQDDLFSWAYGRRVDGFGSFERLVKDFKIFIDNFGTKKVNPLHEQEEVILNYNELADTLATNDLINKYGKLEDSNLVELIELTEKYKTIILKHKRKDYDA